MDRYIRLEIMYGYGMGPQDCHMLCAYWDRLCMVYLAGGYYEKAFQDFWWVNQGEPLFPTVFNVVVDAVVHHYISLVEGSTGWQDGWGR